MSNQKKNILLINYYWPPAGGPGVQRWLGFVKYLVNFGFFTHVYSPKNPSYPILDPSLLKEIPTEFKHIQTNIWEPFRLAELFSNKSKELKKGNLSAKNNGFLDKLLIFIRGNFFIPDARVFWVKTSIKFLKKYILENNIETIISTGPPHSLHLIGLQLKEYFPQINWVADFRDPWTEISYHKHLKLTNWAEKKHKVLEKKVFETANTVIATSYTDAENFKNKGAKNAVTITNGFDVQENLVDETKTSNSKFTLSYVGGLEDLRNPTEFWKILEELLTENKEIKDNLILKFVGNISPNIIHQIKTKHKLLYTCIQFVGYLPHKEAFQEMKKANLLLLFSFLEKENKGIIPGKIYEYLATGKPIFATCCKDSDIEIIIKETKSGFFLNSDNEIEAKKFLIQSFNNWKNNIVVESFNIQQFARYNLTKQLIKHL